MTPGVGISGCILAGGLARRMGGGDKGLETVGGKPILKHVIDRLAPQCDPVVLNINGDPARFGNYGLPVAIDPIEGYAGPLAGILAGLEWTRDHSPGTRWMVSVATDTPFFPEDLVDRFLTAVEDQQADMACAASNGRTHPVFGLWPIAVTDDLRSAIIDEDIRKVDRWTAGYNIATVDFPTDPFDPFFNTNRPEDLQEAERLHREFSR